MQHSQPPPGFVIPPAQQHTGYQPVQQQPSSYPSHGQPQPPYPSYPSNQSSYPPQQPHQSSHSHQQQPFPNPTQPNYPMQPINWMNSNFQSYLMAATSFKVKQKVELLEVLVGWETANKYSVTDQAGNKVFYVGEESGCLSRICCTLVRPFDMVVKDRSGQNILQFSRGFSFGILCCNCCCTDTLTVVATGGQYLGCVEQSFSMSPLFHVKDSVGRIVAKIEGPFCPTSCAGSAVVFNIFDLAGNSIGTIKKEWGGLVREFFTDADYFSIGFPPNLDPTIKALLLGALFMIDFRYFEDDGKGWGGAFT